MAAKDNRDRVLSLLSQRGVIRASDVVPSGASYDLLDSLVREGRLTKVGRGLFTSPDAEHSENHSLVEAAAYVPRGVVCLLSALRFHGIGTQLPFAVWLAVPNFRHPPKSPPTAIEVVRMSDAALGAGVGTHVLEGVPVPIFSPAKTIADCFKYRDAVGVDVAMEALRDGLSRRLVSHDDLFRYAVIDRVAEVMRPYMEAFAA